MTQKPAAEMPDPQRIIRMASAFYESCILFAATDLGIFARLAQVETADVDRLAKLLPADPRGLRLLLDACVALGLLAKEGAQYRNSREAAAFLTPGSPADLTGALRYNRDVYAAWGKLQTMVKIGAPVERPEIHLGADPARTRTFVLSMHSRALGIGRAVVPLLDLQKCRRLLDVGGGPGTYSCLMAQAVPGLQCTVLDLPAVTAIASELIAQQGLSERVQTMGGDYHTAPFPPGNDAVVFFGVLHQESPAAILSLFRKAYAALLPGGRVYVLDMMTDATRASPVFSALFAVNMALTTENGWVFADAELRQWLDEAGFRDCAIKPVGPSMPHWLAAARKP